MGNAYIFGAGHNEVFPISDGACPGTPQGSRDADMAKFSTDGSVLYGTYVGGSGYEVISSGNLWNALVLHATDVVTLAYDTDVRVVGSIPTRLTRRS